MPKYNMGSTSDMRKFQRDLEKTAKDKAVEIISGSAIPIECPFCNAKLEARAGVILCPKCGNKINLEFNFKL